MNGPLSNEDHPLFARAFREHYPDLVAFVRRQVPTDAEAADIAQEAYLRVLRYREEKDLTALRMLVFRIATNLIRMRARTAHVHRWADHVPLEEELLLDAGNPSQDRQVAGEQQLNRLMAAIERLPQRCQQAFLLRRFHGMSLQEIADHMRITRKAVEINITRALALLQEKMGSDWS